MESESRPSIMFTSKDTLDNFENVYGDNCRTRLGEIGSSLSQMLEDDEFLSTMKSSRTNKNILLRLLKTDFSLLVCIPILVVFTIIVAIRYLKINKHSKKPTNTTSNNDKNTTVNQKVFEEFGL